MYWRTLISSLEEYFKNNPQDGKTIEVIEHLISADMKEWSGITHGTLTYIVADSHLVHGKLEISKKICHRKILDNQ